MTQSSPVLADVDGAIDAMLKYAKVIGLKSKGVFGLETADRPNPTDPRDLFVLRDRDRAPNENNCSFCNAFWCRSSEHGGPDACVCRWDSKIDLEGGKLEPPVSGAGKRYILTMRRLHGLNKGIKTLKGLSEWEARDKIQVLEKMKEIEASKKKVMPVIEGGSRERPAGCDPSLDRLASLLGGEITDREAFDAWLHEHDRKSGLGVGDGSLIITEGGAAPAGSLMMIGGGATPRSASPVECKLSTPLRDWHRLATPGKIADGGGLGRTPDLAARTSAGGG